MSNKENKTTNADHRKQRGRTAPNRALSKKKFTVIENLLDRYYSAAVAHNNASIELFNVKEELIALVSGLDWDYRPVDPNDRPPKRRR